ncbi:hypothetical protein AVEN_208337-1, partial [Araneus ventricosus]
RFGYYEAKEDNLFSGPAPTQCPKFVVSSALQL